MARFGIFGLEGSELFEALRSGIWRLGGDQVRHEVVPQNASAWSPAQERGQHDVVVIHGARGRSGDIARWYREHGRPVWMVDLPHIRRPGQWRIGPPGHSWLPELPGPASSDPLPAGITELRRVYTRETGKPCGRRPRKTLERELLARRPRARFYGEERLDRLRVELGSQPRTKGQGICVLGQLGGDASHGLGSGKLREWAEATVVQLRALDTSPIIWRGHPHEKPRWAPRGVDAVAPPGESLAGTLRGCWRAVTHCSTAGLEALCRGLSVVAEGPAVYRDLAGRLDRWAACEKPAPDDLRALLVRIAHTQWSLPEIASGEAFRFLDLPEA